MLEVPVVSVHSPTITVAGPDVVVVEMLLAELGVLIATSWPASRRPPSRRTRGHTGDQANCGTIEPPLGPCAATLGQRSTLTRQIPVQAVVMVNTAVALTAKDMSNSSGRSRSLCRLVACPPPSRWSAWASRLFVVLSPNPGGLTGTGKWPARGVAASAAHAGTRGAWALRKGMQCLAADTPDPAGRCGSRHRTPRSSCPSLCGHEGRAAALSELTPLSSGNFGTRDMKTCWDGEPAIHGSGLLAFCIVPTINAARLRLSSCSGRRAEKLPASRALCPFSGA
jgi:hypothetical protein